VRSCDKKDAKESDFTLVEYHRIKLDLYEARFPNQKMKERGTIAPNFHLKVSLTIIYFLGTWPPVTGKFRLPYLFCRDSECLRELGRYVKTRRGCDHVDDKLHSRFKGNCNYLGVCDSDSILQRLKIRWKQ